MQTTEYDSYILYKRRKGKNKTPLSQGMVDLCARDILRMLEAEEEAMFVWNLDTTKYYLSEEQGRKLVGHFKNKQDHVEVQSVTPKCLTLINKKSGFVFEILLCCGFSEFAVDPPPPIDTGASPTMQQLLQHLNTELDGISLGLQEARETHTANVEHERLLNIPATPMVALEETMTQLLAAIDDPGSPIAPTGLGPRAMRLQAVKHRRRKLRRSLSMD